LQKEEEENTTRGLVPMRSTSEGKIVVIAGNPLPAAMSQRSAPPRKRFYVYFVSLQEPDFTEL
jgi:hypothetical protein